MCVACPPWPFHGSKEFVHHRARHKVEYSPVFVKRKEGENQKETPWRDVHKEAPGAELSSLEGPGGLFVACDGGARHGGGQEDWGSREPSGHQPPPHGIQQPPATRASADSLHNDLVSQIPSGLTPFSRSPCSTQGFHVGSSRAAPSGPSCLHARAQVTSPAQAPLLRCHLVTSTSWVCHGRLCPPTPA